MLLMRPRLKLADPPKNWVLALAKKLQAGNPLDRAIVLALVGRPHRYAELLPFLRGKGENNLTQALKRLRFASVTQMRTNFHVEPSYDYYELTDLGIDVVMTLAELRAVERVVRAARAGRLSDPAFA